MKYEKPEVTNLGPALDMVQSCGKAAHQTDCNSQQGTAGAYEADE
jgi:hypothetical protein